MSGLGKTLQQFEIDVESDSIDYNADDLDNIASKKTQGGSRSNKKRREI